MGLFYTNFTVFGPESRQILDALRNVARCVCEPHS